MALAESYDLGLSRGIRLTKSCTRCDTEKELSEFYGNSRSKDGKGAYCKVCSNAASNSSYHRLAGDRREETNEANRRALLRNRYGIPADQVEDVLATQRAGGTCEICGEIGVFHIDHDSRGLRGFLCGRCNRGIGMFHDNPRRLLSAIRYLERAACRV